MNLSPHFTLEELTATQVRSMVERNRVVSDSVRDALAHLCTDLLEPVRTHFGRPVIIHSGYRCPELNAMVGGSSTSQHRKGEAADFHVHGLPLVDVARWIASSGAPFGQLILEGGSPGAWGWIHLSLGAPWRDSRRCGEVLTYDGSTYRRGLP